MEENYTPKLTLTPQLDTPAAQIPETVESADSVEMKELSPEELQQVEQFAAQIDISDSNMVLQYGAAAQKNIAEFSSSALDKVRTKDMGEVGGMITDLVVQLKGFDIDENQKGLKGLFKRGANKAAALKARYDEVEDNVDKISAVLEDKQIVLLKDIATLDKMYDMNLAYFKELSMYILAGKQKLQQVRDTELVQLRQKAEQSALPQDAQAANDLDAMCNRFDKKLHDLELTRMVSIQMAPQIRLLQNNDSMMVEKIQSSIVNTIPLWKNQMVLALGMHHSQQAMQAQREVTEMTNRLLIKNSEALKQGTLDIARESERAIIDVETLKKTNENLISTLDEVKNIQIEGAQKRKEAEAELVRIEDELKNKLLEFKK